MNNHSSRRDSPDPRSTKLPVSTFMYRIVSPSTVSKRMSYFFTGMLVMAPASANAHMAQSNVSDGHRAIAAASGMKDDCVVISI